MTFPDLTHLAFTRRLIALGVTFTSCAGFLQGKVPAEAFIALVSMIITFYFTKAQVNELLRSENKEELK